MSLSCRAILDPAPASGAWNMAVDEALLESALARGTCAVRLYRWEEATLSLGYFQNPGDVADDSRWTGLPRVRRLSGGGAILHHHEWTYSCVLPPGHPLAAVPHLLYERVHHELLAVLARRGVAAALRGDAAAITSVGPISDPSEKLVCDDQRPGRSQRPVRFSPDRKPADPSRVAPPEAFLCFDRGDARDIVRGGRKIVGSAQRRRRGAVLQHGSILLRRSEFAPEFPGILDLVPDARIDADFADETIARIAHALLPPTDRDPASAADRLAGVRRGELGEEERRRAGELVESAAIRLVGRLRGAAKPQA
ncbi:MAG: hypothetical protein WD066_17570 [Planctomycetaceae bacterium]